MSLYPLQEHWMANSIPEGCVQEGRICAFWKREEHAKFDWAGCEGSGASFGCWPLSGERCDMGVRDFKKAIYANEGRACVEGSAAADGTFEDRRGECSSTRRQSWWKGMYRRWMEGRKDNDSNGLV